MSFFSRLLRLKRRFERPLEVLNHVRISRSALLENYDILCGLAGKAEVFPVLKSNAYGHGLTTVARILKERKITYFAVDSAYEALKIHEVHSHARVLLLGCTTPGNLEKLDFRWMTPTVHDIAGLEALRRSRAKVRIHIEVDTGMARQGFSSEALPEFLSVLKTIPHIELEGVYTHLARADEKDFSPTARQLEKFCVILEMIRNAGFSPRWIHLANSPGIPKLADTFEKVGINACRAGLALYGLNPLEPGDDNMDDYIHLRPALEWTTTLVERRTLRAGESVSYNALFTAPHDMEIGTVPVGYYEGIPRSATGKWAISTPDGRALPILGRVCMNLCVVDLSAAPELRVGDRLVVVSQDNTGSFGVSAFATASGTISYEAVTGIAESIRREVGE